LENGMSVEELQVSERLKGLLRGAGIERLFPPQAEAVRQGLLDGQSLVVSSPTGSGKSLIALLAAMATVETGGRAVYAAPLRSLVYERAAEWGRFLEPLGARVSVATGDYDRVEPWLEKSDALLLTYEKLDSLLRHGASWLSETRLLVVDEAHYIGEPRRGPVLETVIARFRRLAPLAQVIAMSATIPNAEELAEWLSARLVRSSWRPVPLREGVGYSGRIAWADGGESRYERYTGNASLDIALDAVAQGGQALVFVNSRKKAVELASRLAQRAALDQKLRRLLDPGRNPLAELASRPEHRSLNSLLQRLASYGVGFHHAGLASYQREAVENAFRRGLLRVLVATPTLAAGVNLPARRVVVDSVYRYSGGRSAPISVSEYKQLAGRAGRPGLDPYGEAVIVARSSSAARGLLERYIHGSPEPVVSKLVSEKALRSQVLAVSVAEGSISGVLEVFRGTFYAYMFGDPRSYVEDTVRLLADIGLLEAGGSGSIRATQLGRRVAELYIDPLTAQRMLRGLERLYTGRPPVHDVLFLALWNSDSVLARPPRRLQLDLEAEAEEYLEGLGFDPLRELTAADVAQAAQALYTVDILVDWIMEAPEDKILEKYGIDPGDLRAVTETATWLVYAMQQLAEIKGHPAAPWLRRLEAMVKSGVREELVELVQLPHIGRVRARMLYEAGLRSLSDIARAGPERLAALLPGLGAERAREAVEAARRLLLKQQARALGGGDELTASG
jgi:helicase